MISQRLSAFLQTVDIVKPVAVPEEIQKAVEAQLYPRHQPRRHPHGAPDARRKPEGS